MANELAQTEANFVPLSPVHWLDRAAAIFPERNAIIYGSISYTWSQLLHRCRRLASALSLSGISPGDVVAVLAPNIPAMYEVHFGVPMAGAILNCINVRLDARTVAVLLHHSEARAIIVDQEYVPLVSEAISICAKENSVSYSPLNVVVSDPKHNLERREGALIYEDFLLRGDPEYRSKWPANEWDTISLCYTSGTTASPKGVALSHRGAYLSALSNIVAWEMKHGLVYLWTLPLFHVDGWCFAWAVAAIGGTNVCLRQVTAKGIYSAISKHGVTHLCAAPAVLNTIMHAEESEKLPIKEVQVMTAGAPPPAKLLAKVEEQGFCVTHTYGLSETYGPSTYCAWKPQWDSLSADQRANLKSRQGVKYLALEDLDVVDLETMVPVPSDGKTIGEVVMKGNMVMKGYFKNPQACKEAFKGGWFHSGDLAVKHPDGYIEIKDRAKDIIISGGENISSLEVESILYKHPLILEASVVARPDEKWGESPCAFVALKKGVHLSEEDVIRFCRENLPRFMVPRTVIFGPLARSATGKVQKHLLRSKVKELGPLPYDFNVNLKSRL